MSVVPRIAEVSVSMELAEDDARGKVGCCVATSGLGLNGTRSLSIESWSSLKRMGSGTSYELSFKKGDAKSKDMMDVLSVAAYPTFLHDSRGFQHSLIETSNQVARQCYTYNTPTLLGALVSKDSNGSLGLPWTTPIRQNHTLDASTYVQSRLYEMQFEHRFPGIWTPSPMITNVALAYN